MSVFAASMSAQRGNNIDARKLQLALYAISNLYVDSTSETKLVEDAIVGMLEKLDPHSTYTDPEETKEMTEPLQGNFDGIGIQFNMLTDTLYVIQVIPGGPSEKVGLMAGDRIIMVDDTLIAGVKMKTTDIMKRLRGPKGTEVNIKVLRNKNPELIEFKIIRGKIPVTSMDAAYMADKQTGYSNNQERIITDKVNLLDHQSEATQRSGQFPKKLNSKNCHAPHVSNLLQCPSSQIHQCIHGARTPNSRSMGSAG